MGLLTFASGGCTNSNSPCRTPQYAVDQANPDEEVRVAEGTHTSVSARNGLTRMVYISKTVTMRGDHATGN